MPMSTTGPLDVESDGSNPADVRIYGFGGVGTVHMYRANDTKVSPDAVINGDMVGALGVRPYNGTEYSEHSTAGFWIWATQNHNSSNQGTKMEFFATPDGETWEERVKAMTIEGDLITFHVPVSYMAVSGTPPSMEEFMAFNGSLTGWSSLTRDERFFRVVDGIVYFNVNIAGTSNATTVSIQMPVAAHTRHYRVEGQCGHVVNNGTAGQGRWSIDPDTNILTIWTGVAGGWTASGTKEVRLEGFYEAEPEEE